MQFNITIQLNNNTELDSCFPSLNIGTVGYPMPTEHMHWSKQLTNTILLVLGA